MCIYVPAKTLVGLAYYDRRQKSSGGWQLRNRLRRRLGFRGWGFSARFPGGSRQGGDIHWGEYGLIWSFTYPGSNRGAKVLWFGLAFVRILQFRFDLVSELNRRWKSGFRLGPDSDSDCCCKLGRDCNGLWLWVWVLPFRS